jgi:hypothetical protein
MATAFTLATIETKIVSLFRKVTEPSENYDTNFISRKIWCKRASTSR